MNLEDLKDWIKNQQRQNSDMIEYRGEQENMPSQCEALVLKAWNQAYQSVIDRIDKNRGV